jgi:hypothetical protein
MSSSTQASILRPVPCRRLPAGSVPECRWATVPPRRQLSGSRMASGLYRMMIMAALIEYELEGEAGSSGEGGIDGGGVADHAVHPVLATRKARKKDTTGQPSR